jgi:hypothetical protein
MKRRLRIAGTALGAFLVPACASVKPEPIAKLPAVVPPSIAQRAPAPGTTTSTTAAKMPRTVEKFGEGRTEQTTAFAQPPAPAKEMPIATAPPTPTTIATAEPVIAESVSQPPVPAPTPRLTSAAPAEREKPKAEPAPDADGVIRTSWPTLKGPVSAETPAAPVLPPPGDLIAPTKADAALPQPPLPGATPPALPPGVIGTSTHKSNASPVDTAAPVLPSIGMETTTPIATTGDTPLVRAVRAFQQNHPDEAVECLKACDPVSQQALLSLMPTLIRLSDSRLQQIKPEEMDVMLEQINRVPGMLRARGSLQANNVRLCREVHNFGHVEPFPAGHQFHPGDIVYLYMELANFSCTADSKGGYSIMMASGLEMHDATGKVVWRADPKEIPDAVSSPPQDYYRNFRLSVPGLPPGAYSLVVKTTDRPTGREVTKAVELRIGSK